jgi:amino acid adenylation domain-containing protein
MSVAEFLAELAQRGISVWADGEHLHYRATKDALTPALREELRQRKASILAFLRSPSSQSASAPPPLLPAKREGALPLSFSQERLWFLQQLEPESHAYVEPSAVKLVGPVQVEALEKSINTVVQRHENLRTTFISVQGNPCQVIAASLQMPLPVFDLTALAAEEHQAEAQWLFAEAGRVTFDLSCGPLQHFYLVRLGHQKHILLTTLHHIISDRASGGLFFNEMLTFYQAYSQTAGQQVPLSLPELPIQYADYALWQREWLQGEALEHHLSYWRQQLAGAPPLLELPTDFPRPTVKSYSGSHLSFALPATLCQGLRALSAREGTTLFMTLLAAFQTLLLRYSGQDDIAVGTSVTSRTRVELERLIGLFINTLVLRSDLSGNPTFRQLLKRVRSVCLSAYEHQDLPFEKLVEALQPGRNLSYSPLFQVAFSLEHAPGASSESADLTLESIAWTNNTAKFDLSLTLVETRTALVGRLEYSTDLFTEETIARLARHFQTLLESIVANPDQCLSDLPLLRQAERAQMLVEWNPPPTPLPEHRSLHAVFEDRVIEQPDTVALVFEEQQLTYAELNTRANQLAHHLQTLGVGPEVRVGLCLDRSVEAIIGLLGILKAGGAYVPLDPSSPRERLAFMLTDSQVKVVLTQQRWHAQFADQAAAPLLCCLDSDWEQIARQTTTNGSSSVSPDNLAYLLYTSGSTGQPKGVLITHAQVVHYVHACVSELGLASCARFALVQPLTVDSTVTLLYSALFLGQTLYLYAREQALDPMGLNAAFRAQAIDCLKIAPSHLRALQAVAGESLLPRQRLIIGGEASSWEWVQGLAAKHPECQVINHYGPTETTVGVLIYPVPGEIPTHEPAYSTTPLGRPLPRIQAYILDAHFEPVPIGVPGELYLGGAGLARGYLNRPDLTAERFVPHPFSHAPGARLYRTGDLVRARSNGMIEFIGRSDEQVKLHGFRIEPGEIESMLATHSAVSQALVTVREDTHDDQRLVAYVVPTEGAASPTPAGLRQYAQERLPDYMVPAAFVLLDALPLTPHGKVNRRALPPPDWAAQSTLPAVPPRTPTEAQLASLWAQVLHRDTIGIHDNFFDLGGHSLLATQLMARIFDTFHQALPLRTLFEAPTIATFALRLEEHRQQPDPEKQPEVMPFVPRARYRGLASRTTQADQGGAGWL